MTGRCSSSEEDRVIAVDVGGTKIAVGDVDPTTGDIRCRQVARTRSERGTQAVLNDVLELVESTLERRSRDLDVPHIACRRIGLSVAELVGLDGEVTSGQSLPWKRAELVSAFAPFGEVVICSDVRVAALAEARLGAGRSHASFVYVSVGTGLSSTLVIDGVPFPGANGNAIIAGSGAITYECSACGAQGHHVPERIASGAGLVHSYGTRTGRTMRDAHALFRLADQGDEVAIEVLQKGGDVLGNVLATLVNLLDPGAIVIGGGLGSAAGIYRDAWERSLRTHIWAETSRGVPIATAALGSDSALVGAALAATEHET